MKTAAKVLCIIALIVGLIWATVGFFGSWVGGGVSAGVQVLIDDTQGAASTVENTVNLMIRLIGSFIVVIAGGVLGIVGADKNPAKVKTIILGLLTGISGCFLFPLNNYIPAVIYLFAGFLLLLAGLTTKEKSIAGRRENDTE
jgi:hypothetical protein